MKSSQQASHSALPIGESAVTHFTLYSIELLNQIHRCRGSPTVVIQRFLEFPECMGPAVKADDAVARFLSVIRLIVVGLQIPDRCRCRATPGNRSSRVLSDTQSRQSAARVNGIPTETQCVLFLVLFCPVQPARFNQPADRMPASPPHAAQNAAAAGVLPSGAARIRRLMTGYQRPAWRSTSFDGQSAHDAHAC